MHFAAMSGSKDLLALLLDRAGDEQLLRRNALGQVPADAARDFATCAYLTHRMRLFTDSRIRWVHGRKINEQPRDSYAGRTMLDEARFEDGCVMRVETLLQNSRADFVKRVLCRRSRRKGTDPRPLSGKSFEAVGGSFNGDSPSSLGVPKRRTHVRTPSTDSKASGRRNFSQLRMEGSSVTGAAPSDFEPVKDLGQGGFGVVIQVQHRRTQKMYAMKMYDKLQMLDQNMLSYVKNERDILTYVKHPFIVRLHWAIQTHRHLMLILQLGCGTLKERVKREARRKLEEPLARVYTGEILLALCWLHARDICYRDLKPENVVMDDDGHVLLIDFGLSKQVISNSTQTFVGTKAYMAPEMFERDPRHNKPVDIYGLGVILHFMLVGWEPFLEPSRKNQDQTTIWKRIKNETLVIPEGPSREAGSLIEQTMRKNPATRLVAQQVKDHEFFLCRPCNIGASWEALERREVWLPDETDDVEDPVPITPTASRTQRGTARIARRDDRAEQPPVVGRGVKQFERTVISTDDNIAPPHGIAARGGAPYSNIGPLTVKDWDFANTDDYIAPVAESQLEASSLTSVGGSCLPITPRSGHHREPPGFSTPRNLVLPASTLSGLSGASGF